MIYQKKEVAKSQGDNTWNFFIVSVYILIINVLGIASDNVTFSTHDATSGFGRS